MPFLNYTLFIWPFLAAVLIDLILGEYPAVIHPVVLMGRFISKASGKAGRCRSLPGRFFAGAAVVCSGIVIFCIPAALIWGALGSTVLFSGEGVLFALFMLYIFKSSFCVKGLFSAAFQVEKSLKSGDLYEARRLTSFHLVSRDTSELSEDEVVAAVIESISENLTDSVASPWFFYLLGGPAAAVGYRFANTCDSMIGYRTEKYEWLGKFAARLDDVLNFVPARIAALMIIISAVFHPDLSGRNAVKTVFREHGVVSSPNAGWTMAAAAGALGVRLVKNNFYEIRGGTELPGIRDIKRAITLISTAVVFLAISVIILILILSGMIV